MARKRMISSKLLDKCDKLLEKLTDSSLQIVEKNIIIEGFLAIIQKMIDCKCDFDDTQDQLVALLEELRRQDYKCVVTVNKVLVVTFQLLTNTKASELCIFFKVDIDDSECFLRSANETHFLITCKSCYRLGEYMVSVLIDTRTMFSYAIYDKAEHLFGHIRAILRYGLSTSISEDAGTKSEDILGDVPMSKHCMCDLLTFCLLTIYNLVNDEEEPEENKMEVDIFVDCVKLVLKAIGHLSCNYVRLRCQTLGVNHSHVLEAIEMVNQRIPELDDRLGSKVPILQHLSRCVIRQLLYDNWALPNGINSLEIPDVLKAYLDLKI